jgi:hypothetical protein
MRQGKKVTTRAQPELLYSCCVSSPVTIFSIDFFLPRWYTRRGSIRYFGGRASSLRAAVLEAAARSSFAQSLA